MGARRPGRTRWGAGGGTPCAGGWEASAEPDEPSRTALPGPAPAGPGASQQRDAAGIGVPEESPEAAHHLPIEEMLDLHAFAPRDIPEVVRDYLAEAHRLGLREVRIVHGRGIGVQRERVRSILAGHPLVERFGDAPAERGHWGATIVWLAATGRQLLPGDQAP